MWIGSQVLPGYRKTPTVLEHGGLASYSLPGISETMPNEDARANRNCPTNRGIVDRTHGRDATTDIDRLLKTLPPEEATAWTGNRTGAQTRPVERSTIDTNNLVDDGLDEVLIARLTMEAGSDE